MSLLSTLGLPTLPKFARPPSTDAAAAKPPAEPAGRDAAPANGAGDAGRASAALAPNGADSAAAARTLRDALDKRASAAREAHAKLLELEPKLDATIAASTDEARKKALVEKKAAMAAHVAELERVLKTVEADRLALDDPRSDARTYNAILARNRSAAPIGKLTVVDRHDEELEKKRMQTRRTETTTSYADGQATTRVDDRSRSVGLGGATASSVQTREVIGPDGRTTTTASRTDTVSKDGYSSQTVRRREREREADGKTSSIEKKNAFSVGPGGISGSEERTETHADGSGSARKKAASIGPGGASRTEQRTEKHADGSATGSSTTQGIERGDGRLGAARSTTRSTTDASGTETKSGTATKGGVMAGKDGMGAYAERERSVERTTASGLKTGAVAGLNANVSCQVKQVKDSDPALYELVVSINLGVSASVSAAQDKEGADGKAGVKASASAAVFMNRSYRLKEAEATAYLAGLQAASKGSGDATRQEFAIVGAGVSKSWDVAREMYLATRGKTGSAADVDRMRTGDSTEVGKKTHAGVAVNAEAEGFGVSLGAERDHDESAKVTKEADGSATYETQVGDSTKGTAGAKVSMGVASGGASFSHTAATSTGYKISIAPSMANARALQDELARCSSQAALDAFAKAHPETVQEKTTTKSTADAQTASAGIGGAQATLAYSHGVDESATTDGSGKLLHSETTGKNSSGMEISLGKLKVGASSKQAAAAKTDADGNTTVDVTQTDTSTDANKFLEAHLPFYGKKKKDPKGALAAVTGAADEPPDIDTRDVTGISLSGADLGYLGDLACSDFNKWMRACPSPSMMQDWRKAGNAVRKAGGDKAAVARELARFVGADAGNRSDVVNALVRPAGDVSTGARYEFPDSLAKQRPTYEALVVAESEKRVDAAAKKDGDAKAREVGSGLVGQLDGLAAVVRDASGFSQPAVQGEMLSAIDRRLVKVQARIAALGGGGKDPGAAAKAALDRYDRLLGACRSYKKIEDECFAKIAKTFKGGSNPDLGETIANATLIRQVRDLHATWRHDYDEMAALAQENDWGADIYWKYKPDVARFERAIKGNPGDASKAEPETEDKRSKPAWLQPPAPKDPVGDGNRAVKEMGRQSAQGIEQKLPAAKNRAHGAANRLYAWIQADRKPAAVAAHNAGMEKMKPADATFARCKPGNADDFNAYGAVAMEDYDAAVRSFRAGLALYPKGMPPKA